MRLLLSFFLALLLNACAGLVVPDSGAVWLATGSGRDNLAGLPQAARARQRRR